MQDLSNKREKLIWHKGRSTKHLRTLRSQHGMMASGTWVKIRNNQETPPLRMTFVLGVGSHNVPWARLRLCRGLRSILSVLKACSSIR